jgi:hypothetical protein
MLTKKRIPLLIAFIFCLEAVIYLWAICTTETEFVFDKCARNAGRASSAIILITLLMVGYYGLKGIYLDDKKKDAFRILITLFAINHLVHFFYVFMRFKSHFEAIDIAENLHGFITFIFIIIVPFILWTFKDLNKLLYFGIILHLFNVSYFICKTFLGKVKPDHPAYHNQFGIVVITAACLIFFIEFFAKTNASHLRISYIWYTLRSCQPGRNYRQGYN